MQDEVQLDETATADDTWTALSDISDCSDEGLHRKLQERDDPPVVQVLS